MDDETIMPLTRRSTGWQYRQQDGQGCDVKMSPTGRTGLDLLLHGVAPEPEKAYVTADILAQDQDSRPTLL